MAKRFRDALTAELAQGICRKGTSADLVRVARRKIALVLAAAHLDDLKSPPGNRLHSLSGDRAGQHAVRVNDQFRICFRWLEGGATEIEFTDYH